MKATQSELFISGENNEWEKAGDGMLRQILGFDGQLMLVRVLFEEGAVGPVHEHHHRQISYVESGAFMVEIDGEKRLLKTGDSFYVPPNVAHGAVAIEKGCLLDIFSPVREDFLI